MFLAVTLLLIGEISQTTLLTVEVTGFEEQSGEARLAVFGPGDSFPMEIEEAVYKEIKPVDSDPLVFTISSLSPGTYAIYAYHDKDGDGELDMHWYGPPSEKVGVSNNATGFAGPPSFDDASFELGSEPLVLTLSLR